MFARAAAWMHATSHIVGRASRADEIGEVAADVRERGAIATDLMERAAVLDVDVEPAQPALGEIDRQRHGDERAAAQIEALRDGARIERAGRPPGASIRPAKP